MKKIFLIFLFINSIIYADIVGEYIDKYGSTIKIERNGTMYILTARDFDGTYWEGIGYFSKNKNYLKSVFHYISNKNTYGDNVGFHEFKVQNNGKTLIKYGGWNNTREFGKSIYTKK
jgi:hypothetical protein